MNNTNSTSPPVEHPPFNNLVVMSGSPFHWQERAEEQALATLPPALRASARRNCVGPFSLKTPPSRCGIYLLFTQISVGFAYYSSVNNGWSVTNMNFRVFRQSKTRLTTVRPTPAMLGHWQWKGLSSDFSNLLD